jgi:rSAM/selenodomain-associated transferase 2
VRPALSIIVPVLNEAQRLTLQAQAWAQLRHEGCELIVVDGGSTDATLAVAGAIADIVTSAARGRARQMNEGARLASADRLLFLHADSQLPGDGHRQIIASLPPDSVRWGRFDVSIVGVSPWFALISAFINKRSRWTSVATGDQGIFMTQQAYAIAGGFPDIALMEDVAICKRLRQFGRPICLRGPMLTSGRRWEKHGILATIVLMWRLRFDYWRGISPERLHQRYYGKGHP